MAGKPAILAALVFFMLTILASAVAAQGGGPTLQAALGTAFTYQGRLQDGGSLANGAYDIQFALYDAASGGAQVGATVTANDVPVSNGLFTVSLDFGASVFTGDARWLEMRVRPGASSGGYTTLTPRQPVTATPYALYAKTAPWSGLAGVPAGFADGVDNEGWSLTGNSGTTAGTNFIGTTDNTALEVKVNSARALRMEPNATSPNLIGGSSANTVTSGVVGATIGGGGRATNNCGTGSASCANRVTDSFGTVGGGIGNQAGDNAGTSDDRAYATVGGGRDNTASGAYATVGGGGYNTASGFSATAGGGYDNTASGVSATAGGGYDNTASGDYATAGGGVYNAASGDFATVGGGYSNTASGDYATAGGGASNTASGAYATAGGGSSNTASGDFATVGGGRNNTAQGAYSFVAGRRAKANADGMFVWADSYDEPFAGSVANSFIVRASGGIYFGTADPINGAPSGKFIDTWTGAHLTNGGTWTNASDRAAKENFANVNAREILTRVANLPIQTWNYIAEQATIRHIGPTAQDFYAAFGVGADDTHIATIDADGVALAAIQGLHQVVQEKEAQIAELEARLAVLEHSAGSRAAAPPASPIADGVWFAAGVLCGAGAFWLGRRRPQGGR